MMNSKIWLGWVLVGAMGCHEAGRRGASAGVGTATGKAQAAGVAREAAAMARVAAAKKSAICCEKNIPARFAVAAVLPVRGDTVAGARDIAGRDIAGHATHEGMIWIPGGTFRMGADNDQAAADEYPKHLVTVSGFWMDRSEVTNVEFADFVRATGYVTTAERAPDWNELKKQLPPGTPKPDASLLVPASLVFTPPDYPVELGDYSQWWSWVKGADWRH
ncbi:MAG TPA: SUMF1/EgtB/PvdO family nonheme iron enzyme, partial [Puia sp.]|nr:SUMF1/EgtB/PvdO family nonheme iron enzyme [Puia sp.]